MGPEGVLKKEYTVFPGSRKTAAAKLIVKDLKKTDSAFIRLLFRLPDHD
jgi:hypothetical protein